MKNLNPHPLRSLSSAITNSCSSVRWSQALSLSIHGESFHLPINPSSNPTTTSTQVQIVAIGNEVFVDPKSHSSALRTLNVSNNNFSSHFPKLGLFRQSILNNTGSSESSVASFEYVLNSSLHKIIISPMVLFSLAAATAILPLYSSSSSFNALLSPRSPSSSLFSLSRIKLSSMFFPFKIAPPLLAACCTSSSSSSAWVSQDGPFPDSSILRPQIMPFALINGEDSGSKPSYKWRRVLLKVSGEALAGDNMQNIDPKVTMSIAREVASVTRLGVEVAIVVGGGNIFRGASWAGSSGLDRSSADYIGMLATVMNAIFLQATMESIGIPTRVQTAFRMSEVAEPYIRRRAVRHLEKGRVVIFAAGTGNPFFTTDTAAALRCAEINAEVVLKATNVDGVYDKDPKCNPDAQLLDNLCYQDVTTRDLSVMDMTAITLCHENNIPVVVFNLNKPGNIAKAIVGERVGTLIGPRSQQQRSEGGVVGQEFPNGK